MITVEAVTRNYGAFTAVDDVSFTARPGRVTGFLGPNGAGKSTTMRIIVGLTRATSGTATISGRRASAGRRCRILRKEDTNHPLAGRAPAPRPGRVEP